MAAYAILDTLLSRLPAVASESPYAAEVIPYLVSVWLADYERTSPNNEVVETSAQGFSYLFDLRHERLLAAWGVSQGKSGELRDKSRMKGHPKGAGQHYHRGHAIPHSLGGPTAINLVPQRGSVNVGAFRALEIEAVATPGALYFTYWIYGPSSEQRPIGVDQGLLVPGRPARIKRHPN